MAHFARIFDGIVHEVIVIDNRKAPDPFPESETAGLAFIASLGLSGDWKQTSYNSTFRAHYAGIGYTYDAVNDVFYSPQPFPSWHLDEHWNWQPPVPYPDDGGRYEWDEEAQQWVPASQ